MSDNYKTDCRFSELAISYLYGEIASRDRRVFESHLEKCPACTREIKSYDLVRDSIAFWKKNEFDLLATAKIEFMPEQPVKTTESLKSWFDDVSKIFATWKTLAAGSAFILLLTSMILLSRMFSGVSEVASLQYENLQKTERAPNVFVEEDARASENVTGDETANLTVEKKTAIVSDDKNSSEKETKLKSVNNQIAAAAPKSTVIYSKPENSPLAGKNVLKQTFAANVRKPGATAAVTRQPKSLKLNSLDEETEEVAPRLTDLFEAVGEK